MKSKTYTNIDDLAYDLGLSKEQIEIVKLKTKLKKKIASEVKKRDDLNQTSLAELSGLSRTVVSGIINNSLQSVSLERLIRLAIALDLSVDLRIKQAS